MNITVDSSQFLAVVLYHPLNIAYLLIQYALLLLSTFYVLGQLPYPRSQLLVSLQLNTATYLPILIVAPLEDQLLMHLPELFLTAYASDVVFLEVVLRHGCVFLFRRWILF